MVQGLYNVKNGQPISAIYFGDNAGAAYIAKQQEPDSFNGKTLLTLAAVAGAVIFRKNIMTALAPFIGKHPKLANSINSTAKYVQEFYAKHADNSIMKFAAAAWKKTGEWGDRITKYATRLFESAKAEGIKDVASKAS